MLQTILDFRDGILSFLVVCEDKCFEGALHLYYRLGGAPGMAQLVSFDFHCSLVLRSRYLPGRVQGRLRVPSSPGVMVEQWSRIHSTVCVHV